MEIEKIDITLVGNHDISKLGELGYKKVLLPHTRWIFLGRVHVYSFTSLGDKVLIEVGKREGSHLPLVPEVTMGQMNSWVLDSIKKISM